LRGELEFMRRELDRLSRHPNALMLPTLAADTTGHIRRVGAVLEVMPAGRSQCGLKRRRPLVVGLGEPPHLIRSEAKLAQRRPERFTGINPIQKLLPQLDR
jgi:hypothetical protein